MCVGSSPQSAGLTNVWGNELRDVAMSENIPAGFHPPLNIISYNSSTNFSISFLQKFSSRYLLIEQLNDGMYAPCN